MNKPLRFYVEIVNSGTDEVVKRMGPHSDRKSEKVFDGACINLNHDEYYVRIVEDMNEN